MFVYQRTFIVLEFKKGKGTEYDLLVENQRVYNSKPIALHSAFLPNIKHFRHKIEIKFNSTLLVIE